MCSYRDPWPKSHWLDGHKPVSPESSSGVTAMGKDFLPVVLAQTRCSHPGLRRKPCPIFCAHPWILNSPLLTLHESLTLHIYLHVSYSYSYLLTTPGQVASLLLSQSSFKFNLLPRYVTEKRTYAFSEYLSIICYATTLSWIKTPNRVKLSHQNGADGRTFEPCISWWPGVQVKA